MFLKIYMFESLRVSLDCLRVVIFLSFYFLANKYFDFEEAIKLHYK